MTVRASESVPMHFIVPIINCRVNFSIQSDYLNTMQTALSQARGTCPDKLAKNIELIKPLAATALAALAAFITMPVWLSGMIVGTAVLGIGIWVAAPLMGVSLWLLSERIVDAFHRQCPQLLEGLAAQWSLSPEKVTFA